MKLATLPEDLDALGSQMESLKAAVVNLTHALQLATANAQQGQFLHNQPYAVPPPPQAWNPNQTAPNGFFGGVHLGAGNANLPGTVASVVDPIGAVVHVNGDLDEWEPNDVVEIPAPGPVNAHVQHQAPPANNVNVSATATHHWFWDVVNTVADH